MMGVGLGVKHPRGDHANEVDFGTQGAKNEGPLEEISHG